MKIVELTIKDLGTICEENDCMDAICPFHGEQALCNIARWSMHAMSIQRIKDLDYHSNNFVDKSFYMSRFMEVN